MAGLLVSVRSASEALAALAGGASVIDIKEPHRGPLGRADVSVWRAVRALTPATVPLSVALGELREWAGIEDATRAVPSEAFAGIDYRKLGLAGAGPNWAEDWAALRAAWGVGPAWVAVAYADWKTAAAPSVDEVLEASVSIPECVGLLIDTFDKTHRVPMDLTWRSWIERAHKDRRFVALAGGLTESLIARLAPLEPDLFAVRGAACRDGDRHAPIDADLVARLAECAGSDREHEISVRSRVPIARVAQPNS